MSILNDMTADSRPVAFVTGASRGMGRASAIALARAGYDVAVTARTVSQGEPQDYSPSSRHSDITALPGSLEETATRIGAEGGRALVVPADILDESSLERAVGTVLDRWGRIDVLMNNARYIGPGHMDTVLDTTSDMLLKHFVGNVLAPLALDRLVLRQMIERGSGVIIHVTSAASFSDTTAKIGSGGWGMSYGVTKGALHRATGYLRTEHADDGVLIFNLQPGTIVTEQKKLDAQATGVAPAGEPAEVVGAAVAWLCTDQRAAELNGRTVEAPFLVRELGLMPGWNGPGLIVQGRHDVSAPVLFAMEAALANGDTPPSMFSTPW